MERNIALQIRRQEAHDDRAEETGQVLEWNPATDKIVSDHGFAGEACRAAGRRSRCRQSSRPGVLMTPIAAGAGN